INELQKMVEWYKIPLSPQQSPVNRKIYGTFFCYTPFACAGLNKKRGSNNIAMFKQINII
ncbi:hypothetical protein, partial [uncultured Prevotella sp.]|uniref:hypothetical protein n=1 Tax=uncultured Prevotella sp. TaxID=159272 RepID=UPI0027E22AF8